MCPGLTHPNATLVDAGVDDIVAIMAEGKQHALAIGQMKMSSDEMYAKRGGLLVCCWLCVCVRSPLAR